MRQYIGTKLLKAEPMTLGDYNLYQGWPLPENQDPKTEGYLVEYLDGGEANHPKHKGYISWSPKDVFERAYEHTEHFGFGMALALLKAGYKVTRQGWNGKGMWLIYVQPTPDLELREGSAYWAAGLQQVTINGHIDMMTATGEMQPGWLASQSDLLAEDWVIAE